MSKRFKSASKKTGNLMDVVTDPNYGKDTRGDFKGTYPMVNTNKEDVDMTEIEKQREQKIKEAQEKNTKDAETVKQYNQDIYKETKTIYFGTVPPSHVLVRLEKLDAEVNGIIMQHKLNKPNASGAPGLSKEWQDHPCPYKTVGVVINVNEDNKWLNRGDRVIVDDRVLKPIFDREEHMFKSQFSFTLPEIDDEGYFLIREMEVKYVYPKG